MNRFDHSDDEARRQAATPGSSNLDGFGFDSPDDTWLKGVRSAERHADLGHIGPFELIEEISHGAQGVVYRARQPGTQRNIALKRLAAGRLASPAARARFLREIETAAALDHPNIVTVYGTELVGDQPLLAMEWIEGISIDRWARASDGAAGDVRTILEVFLLVCDAVQHAHQRGVIHRDLKPSNILIACGKAPGSESRAATTGSGATRVVPKVLDFGLAKLICEADTELTLSHDFMGTPAYAAPEQARSDHAAVDVRTDVYALGAVLYRMLTGQTPHSGNLHELLDAIQNVDVALPSKRRADLDHEVDAILRKALSRDPELRYQSVDAFAQDVRRYLAGEAVLAHPPTAGYRLRKLVSRHRLAIALAGTVMLVVSSLAVIATRQAIILAAQREEALAARNDEARARAAAEQITRFLQETLAAADPNRARGRDVTVLELVEQAGQRVEAELSNQPAVEAAVRLTLGRTCFGLGRWDEAEFQLKRSADLFRDIHAGPHADTARAIQNLGHVHQAQGRFDDAVARYQQALAIWRELSPESNEIGQILRSIATAMLQQGDLDAAGAYLAEAAGSGVNGSDPKAMFETDMTMAAKAFHEGRWKESELAARRALLTAQSLFGSDHELTIAARNNLAVSLKKQDRLDEALIAYEESLAAGRRVFGPEHPSTLLTAGNLASLLQARGMHAEAESRFRETHGQLRRILGDDHPTTISTAHNLAAMLYELKRFDEAEDLFRDTLADAEARFGPQHPHTAAILGMLAMTVAEGGGTKAARNEAEAMLVEAQRIFESQLAFDHPLCVKTRENLVKLYGPEFMDDPEKLRRVSTGDPSIP